MAYKLTLEEGDKVIIKINGKWKDGIVEDSDKTKLLQYDYVGIKLSNGKDELVLFPGDKHYSHFGYKKVIVIKKVF